MQNPNQKLAFFLEMAIMDPQFALVIYDDQKQKAHIKAELNKKTDTLIDTPDLDVLKNAAKGIVLCEINEHNLHPILSWMKGAMPTFNAYRIIPHLSQDLRLVFVINKNAFEELENTTQEQILAAFVPIFRYA